MTFLPFLTIGFNCSVSALSSHFIWPPIPTKPNFLSTHPDRATVADTSSDRTASSSRDTSSIFVATPATSSSNRFFLGVILFNVIVLYKSTRESKPCCFRASDTTRRRSVPTTYQEQRSDLRIVPTTRQIEEFFACAEQQQERLFIEKYNFDVVNDLPLSGRYEWMEVGP
ncbi:hypothetical protein EZV62_027126 [Acer yangbiense]|uniref:Cyclin-dependent kinase inhibitor domain-containing protein n=1 Tax=Acer yangbiense TaxID=1000413 RepID=A0A5C7GU31_9ROSI|nr:hypothetical protein EZV62_027126 [Acer yangbiense]